MKLRSLLLMSGMLLGIPLAAPADSLASLFTNVSPAAVKAVPRRPSIVLIICHGLGYGDLSCYGQTNYQTPNLDKLAAEGMRFTSYYAGNADDFSSRAVLLTGKTSAHLPQRADQEVPLDANEITLGQRLEEVGYHTGFIGEWGLGPAPWDKGFNEFAGFIDAADGKNYYPAQMWRYAPHLGYDATNHEYQSYNGPAAIYANSGNKKGQIMPDFELTMASKFMKNNEPDQINHHRPFFLVVDLSVPRSATDGADDYPVPTDAPYSDEPWPQAAKNRVALISRLDTSIGNLFQRLAEPAFSNSVALFFTSDAGPEKFANTNLNFLQPAGNLRGSRGELYEGSLRVPMIARFPGHIPAGVTSDLAWAAWDFMPTIMDLSYIDPALNLDGTSILPVLHGQTITNRNEVFQWSLPNAETTSRAARFGNWKVVQNGTNAPETYDLSVDPQEQTNTANAEIIAKFATLPQ